MQWNATTQLADFRHDPARGGGRVVQSRIDHRLTVQAERGPACLELQHDPGLVAIVQQAVGTEAQPGRGRPRFPPSRPQVQRIGPPLRQPRPSHRSIEGGQRPLRQGIIGQFLQLQPLPRRQQPITPWRVEPPGLVEPAFHFPVFDEWQWLPPVSRLERGPVGRSGRIGADAVGRAEQDHDLPRSGIADPASGLGQQGVLRLRRQQCQHVRVQA